MKGISTVIATILMLMITIGLAGTAYLYISGAFTQQIQGIEIVDAFCSGGTQARITLRNVGTTDVTFDPDDCGTPASNSVQCGSVNVRRTSGLGTFDPQGSAAADATIEPGTTATLLDPCTTATNPVTCVYRITPPSGRGIVATVTCTG